MPGVPQPGRVSEPAQDAPERRRQRSERPPERPTSESPGAGRPAEARPQERDAEARDGERAARKAARERRRRRRGARPRPTLRDHLRTVPGFRAVRDFSVKAWYDGITGLSGMVAYNLLLSIFPLALLALFVFGQVLESQELAATAERDLRGIFPAAAESTIRETLDGVRRSSTSFGIVALVASLWIGGSFWGALDTAFSHIYRMRSRSWVEQKRFGVAMIGVTLLFMAATVAVPTVQSFLASGTRELPIGDAEVAGLTLALTLAGSLVALFAIFCVVFWTVPNRRVPWRAIWPGALGATLATGIVDYAFPLYLTNISTLARAGSTFVFVLVILFWFYTLAFIVLGGAIVNALRYGISPDLPSSAAPPIEPPVEPA